MHLVLMKNSVSPCHKWRIIGKETIKIPQAALLQIQVNLSYATHSERKTAAQQTLGHSYCITVWNPWVH